MNTARIFPRLFVLAILAALVAVHSAASAAPGKTSAKASTKPTIVVAGTNQCMYCLQLKKRLETDASIQSLVKQFNVMYVDITDPQNAKRFMEKFHLQQVSEPTLLIAGPDGATVSVNYGMPIGDGLPNVLNNALQKLGAGAADGKVQLADNDSKPGKADLTKAEHTKPDRKTPAKEAKEKDPQASERITAAREARKLMREHKTAAAVAAVAPYLGEESRTDALSACIHSLEREGKTAIAAASAKLAEPDTQLLGALALVKAKRQYGELTSLSSELDTAFSALEKAPNGKTLREQAEAVDKGRALDEAGEKDPALEAYRQVITNFAHTPVAELAAARVAQLKK
ncbi:MAG: hypothetical protein K8T25_19030 [Planctomycetia bacterium]|nr:hypothetical protein [Planctomycetia bacterium]